MTIGVFPVASSEFEPEVFVKEAFTQEDAEELEIEYPTIESQCFGRDLNNIGF